MCSGVYHITCRLAASAKNRSCGVFFTGTGYCLEWLSSSASKDNGSCTAHLLFPSLILLVLLHTHNALHPVLVQRRSCPSDAISSFTERDALSKLSIMCSVNGGEGRKAGGATFYQNCHCG